MSVVAQQGENNIASLRKQFPERFPAAGKMLSPFVNDPLKPAGCSRVIQTLLPPVDFLATFSGDARDTTHLSEVNHSASVSFSPGNKPNTFLADALAGFHLPRVDILDGEKEVEVCWSENLANNLIISMQVVHPDFVIPEIGSHVLDVCTEFFGLRSRSSESICGWSKHLPETRLLSQQPWFFSQSADLALPLFLSSKACKLLYKVRKDLLSLLRVRWRNKESQDRTWTYCSGAHCDQVVLVGVYKMWVQADYLIAGKELFARLMSRERVLPVMMFHKCSISQAVGDYFSVVPKAGKENLFLFWNGRNTEAVKSGFSSNYSDNALYPRSGKSNVRTTKIGPETVETIDGVLHDRVLPHRTDNTGYHVYAFSFSCEPSVHNVGCVGLEEGGIQVMLNQGSSLEATMLCQEYITYRPEAGKVKVVVS